MSSSADLLRRAAAKLRDHGSSAIDALTIGAPWTVEDDEDCDTTNVVAEVRNMTSVIAMDVLSADHARHIALMHPPVALALADLLDQSARTWDALDGAERMPVLISAVATARLVLREPEETP